MKKTSVFAVAALALLTSACQHHYYDHHTVPVRTDYPDTQYSNSKESLFNSKMIFLADQLDRNLDTSKVSSTYALTTFVDLDKVSNNHTVGRLMAEQLMHELQIRRWNVVELRLGKDISITDAGEFALTRNARRLKNEHELSGVVTGTYSIVKNDIFVNVRVIDYKTGAVASSAQAHFNANSIVGGLIEKDIKSSVAKISVVSDR